MARTHGSWKAYSALALVLASFVGCPTCEVQVDESAVDTDGQGNPDWTTYRGLPIYAHTWDVELKTNIETPRGYGPVDLVEFENAIYSACYRTIAIDKADAYLHICDGVNVDGPPETGEPPTIEDYCPYAL